MNAEASHGRVGPDTGQDAECGKPRADDRLGRAAPPPAARLLHEPVGQPATEKRGERPGSEHQAGQPARQVLRRARASCK